MPRFRRPIPPAPLERYDLFHPAVPEALDGLTILQIADLHVRTPQGRNPAFHRILDAIRWAEPDLIVLNGDYMTRPGDEPAALDALQRLRDAWAVRYGAYAVFGNHDSYAFKVAAREIDGITWIENRVVDLRPLGLPLRLAGASFPEDLLAAMVGAEERRRDEETERRSEEGEERDGETKRRRDEVNGGGEKRKDEVKKAPGSVRTSSLRLSISSSLPLTIAIVHYPTEIFPAADMGIPIVLAGHTHGGQIRPWKGYVPHTSSDIPSHLATGILRLRHTVCCVSRGVGEAYVGIRINCPRQLPLYTLRRGEALGGGEFGTLTQVWRW